MRGMAKIKEAVSEHRSTFGGGGYLRYLKIADGETAECLFISNAEEEPYIIHEHTLSEGRNNFKTTQHREGDCVPCHHNANGDRRIGRASIKNCFTIYDTRWQKRKKNEEKSEKAGDDKFDYKFIDPDKVTKKGIRRGTFTRAGKVSWKMPPMWAQALDAINVTSKKRCRSCGRGRITKIGKVRNKKTGKVREKLECSKCDEPVRTTIFNSIIAVTRAGTGTSTSYQFQVLPDDIPDDVVELLEHDDEKKRVVPYEWEEVLAEPSTKKQAMELGVKNPFRKGEEDEEEAYDYDNEDEEDEEEEDPFEEDEDEDDEDDEAEDEDEDEEEDEPPKRKKKKKSKGLKKKKGSKRSKKRAWDEDD